MLEQKQNSTRSQHTAKIGQNEIHKCKKVIVKSNIQIQFGKTALLLVAMTRIVIIG